MTKSHSPIKTIGKIVGHILLGLLALIAAVITVQLAVMPLAKLFITLDQEQVHNVGGFFDIIVTCLFYFAFVRFFEKRWPTEMALDARSMMLGALSGVVMLGVPILLLFALGYYQVVTYQGMDQMLFVVFGLSAIALGEEFIFRGVLFRILEQHIGSLYALLFVSLSFALASSFAVEGFSAIVLLSIFLTSALWCGIYIWSRSIWVVGLHHAAWNYTEFASGILDEHWRVSAPIVSRMEGPELLTGGLAGPEGSILTVVVCALGLWALYKVVAAKPSMSAQNSLKQRIMNARETQA